MREDRTARAVIASRRTPGAAPLKRGCTFDRCFLFRASRGRRAATSQKTSSISILQLLVVLNQLLCIVPVPGGDLTPDLSDGIYRGIFLHRSSPLPGHQLKRCRQDRHKESEQRIDMPNVFKLVCVCQVLAGPRQKEMTAVERGKRQVERIAAWVSWHDTVIDICLDDFRYFVFDWQYEEFADQIEASLLPGVLAGFEFLDDRRTDDKFAVSRMAVPPLASPIATSHHVGFGTEFVVETGNRGLYVDSRAHKGPSGDDDGIGRRASAR